MKKNILLLTIIALSSQLHSQIIITKNHIIKPGKKLTQAYNYDKHGAAKPGVNMSWDFSNLTVDEEDSMRFGVAGWYEGHANFPLANLAAITYGDETSINFLDVTDTKMVSYGYYSTTDSSVEHFETDLITFPSTYQTSFTKNTPIPGTYAIPLGFDPDSTGPFPLIDSLVISFQINSKSIMDGWGTLKTPLGSFSVLRQNQQQIFMPSTKMYTNGAGFPVPAALLDMFAGAIPTADTSYSINFWTNDATVGFPVMTYSHSNRSDSAEDISWLMSNPQSSSISSIQTFHTFVYPNPVRDVLTIQSDAEIVSASLYNMQGQLVLSQDITEEMQMNVQTLAQGVYTLQLKDANGVLVQAKKIAKL